MNIGKFLNKITGKDKLDAYQQALTMAQAPPAGQQAAVFLVRHFYVPLPSSLRWDSHPARDARGSALRF